MSHLHSPIKFLYFETKGMRQNRVRRVSLVTGGTTNSIGTRTEVMNGKDGSVQVSTQTLNIIISLEKKILMSLFNFILKVILCA